MAAQYELLKELLNSGTKLGFGQEMFFKFYQAFILNDRWVQYIQGVGTTLLVTAIALAMGVVLGSVVALVRVAHDQQRPGRRNPVLGFFNAVCQVYTTIIRGTPMMVQLLIMSMVIFANSRNFTMVGALALGINSGAYVSEIIRGGLMAVDPGQMEAGRSLGLNYNDHHGGHCHSAGHPRGAACTGQRVHHPAQGYLAHHRHRRQGAAVCGAGHYEPYLRGHVPPVGRCSGLSDFSHDLYMAAVEV